MTHQIDLAGALWAKLNKSNEGIVCPTDHDRQAAPPYPAKTLFVADNGHG